jgi:hypothetical protein
MNRRRRRTLRWVFPGLLLLVITIVASARAPSDLQSQARNGESEVSPVQIIGVQVLIMESFPVQVMAHVVGIVPDSCTTLQQPAVNRDRSTIQIDGVRPSGVLCTQVVRQFEGNIPLGPFQPGDYTLQVNDVTTPFHID